MLKLKAFDESSGADAGWHEAKHRFATGPYGNAAHQPIGNLIVLNDDEVAPRNRFGLRHHDNVEMPVRLFQIWLRPSRPGGHPQWGNKPIPKADRARMFVPLDSGRNAEGLLPICTDAEVNGALLQAGPRVIHAFRKADAGYLVPAAGQIEVNGVPVPRSRRVDHPE